MTGSQFGTVFIIGPVITTINNKFKRWSQIERKSYVRLWKLSVSSSLTNCTSSSISSSENFLAQRFLANGRSWATSIAGRLADGALLMRFCEVRNLRISCWMPSRNWAKERDETRKVATTTRITFSFTAVCATPIRSGMMSYFLL